MEETLLEKIIAAKENLLIDNDKNLLIDNYIRSEGTILLDINYVNQLCKEVGMDNQEQYIRQHIPLSFSKLLGFNLKVGKIYPSGTPFIIFKE